MIGFTGSQLPQPAAKVLVAIVAQAVDKRNIPIATGCARGIDQIIKNSARVTMLFRALGSETEQTVRRSARMVDEIVLSKKPRALLAFPSAECPTGIVPSENPHDCFCGKGSETWANAAYAAGRSVPLVVFRAAGDKWLLPEWGGEWGAEWLPIKNGMFGGGYLFNARQT